jgi:hypothetical protein
MLALASHHEVIKSTFVDPLQLTKPDERSGLLLRPTDYDFVNTLAIAMAQNPAALYPPWFVVFFMPECTYQRF